MGKGNNMGEGDGCHSDPPWTCPSNCHSHALTCNPSHFYKVGIICSLIVIAKQVC